MGEEEQKRSWRREEEEEDEAAQVLRLERSVVSRGYSIRRRTWLPVEAEAVGAIRIAIWTICAPPPHSAAVFVRVLHQ